MSCATAIKARQKLRTCSRWTRLLKRTASTISAAPKPLTLVYKTSALLPRAISDPQTLQLWRDVLDLRHQELSSMPRREHTRIAVYGVDARAQDDARNLLAALLQDPFGSQEIADVITAKTGSFVIEHGDTIEDISALRVPSSYFQQFPQRVQLHFIETSSGSIPAEVYKADASIIVCNPLSSQLPQNLHQYGGKTTVVYISPPTSTVTDSICVDSSRALAAVQQLRSSSTTTSASIQRYQDNFTSSGLSSITAFIRSNLTSGNQLAATQAALASVQASLEICETSLQEALRDIGDTFVQSSQLEERVDEYKARAYGEVLGAKASRTGQEDQVLEAVKEAERAMEDVLQRLTWWRMIWRVDELAVIVGSAVKRVWCKDLEKKLILQTGRLSALQQSLSNAANRLLASSTLRSAVLSNSISQLKTAPQYPLTSHSLTHPIHTRLNQIIDYPTTRLHLAGQHAVLGFGSSVTAGAGLSWAGWMGYLAEMGTGTSTAVGVLTAMLGLRWAVGVWERAKVHWWEDWKRVGEGLSRDLKIELETVMNEQVAIVPTRTYEGLVASAMKRKQEILDIRDQVRTLKRESRQSGVA